MVSRSASMNVTGAILAAVIVAGALMGWWRPIATVTPPVAPRAEIEPPTEPVSLADAATEGRQDSKVSVIVFSEFECPYCGVFARDVLPTIRDRYVSTGRVQLAFRHFPLERIHSHAWLAAIATECARPQQAFWLLHDKLFRQQKNLARESLVAAAKEIGLEAEPFSACLADEERAQSLRNSITAAQRLGIRATPTFFFGFTVPDGTVKVTRVLSGVPTIEQFDVAVAPLVDAQVGIARAPVF